jgi:GTPase involved in cell partitioning and DNA repair
MAETGRAYDDVGDGGEGNLVISKVDEERTGLVAARRGFNVELGSEGSDMSS